MVNKSVGNGVQVESRLEILKTLRAGECGRERGEAEAANGGDRAEPGRVQGGLRLQRVAQRLRGLMLSVFSLIRMRF